MLMHVCMYVCTHHLRFYLSSSYQIEPSRLSRVTTTAIMTERNQAARNHPSNTPATFAITTMTGTPPHTHIRHHHGVRKRRPQQVGEYGITSAHMSASARRNVAGASVLASAPPYMFLRVAACVSGRALGLELRS